MANLHKMILRSSLWCVCVVLKQKREDEERRSIDPAASRHTSCVTELSDVRGLGREYDEKAH